MNGYNLVSIWEWVVFSNNICNPHFKCLLMVLLCKQMLCPNKEGSVFHVNNQGICLGIVLMLLGLPLGLPMVLVQIMVKQTGDPILLTGEQEEGEEVD